MAKIPTLIIDLDGTLVECGTFYEQCRQQGATFIHYTTGLPEEAAMDLLRQIEVVAAKSKPAFDKATFPQAFVAAYEAARVIMNPEVTSFTAVHTEQVRRIAERVYDAPYPLFSNVLHTLVELRAAGWQLVLYTKGDHDIQYSKIRRHDLSKYFDGMVITPKKDEHNLEVLCDTYGVDRTRSCYIGDSLRDDIAPGNAVGLKTILITDTCTSWSYNDADVTPWVRVARFHDVMGVVGYGGDTPVGSEEDGGFVALVQPD